MTLNHYDIRYRKHFTLVELNKVCRSQKINSIKKTLILLIIINSIYIHNLKQTNRFEIIPRSQQTAQLVIHQNSPQEEIDYKPSITLPIQPSETVLNDESVFIINEEENDQLDFNKTQFHYANITHKYIFTKE